MLIDTNSVKNKILNLKTNKMPIPTAAIIGAAATLGATGINAASTGKTNRKSRAFAEYMYDKQRNQSLADYTMQNEYNSPTSQMARLKDAGLNPNLIYGEAKGAEAAPIRGTPSANWTPHAPQVDVGAIGQTVGKFYDVQKTIEETDNLKKQNTVLQQQALLLDAQRTNVNADTGSKLVVTDTGKFRLELESQLRQNSLDASDAHLKKTNLENEKLSADTKFTLNQDERAASASAASLQESAARILQMRINNTKVPYEIQEMKARIQDINNSAEIKRLDAELKAKGLQPHDPLWQREVMKLVTEIKTRPLDAGPAATREPSRKYGAY